ncbi:MAG: PepSY domain-containing protein [Thermoproteota archaeon]|nr:PepSY domain-containing protein [Thermoproteota archaeon]
MTISLSTILLATLMSASISTAPSTMAQSNSTATTNNTNASSQALSTSNVTSTNATNMANQNTMTRDNGYGGGWDDRTKSFGKNHKHDGLDKTGGKINGTIDIMDTTYQAISSKFNLTLSQAINNAEQTVGNSSYAMSATTEEKDGYLVYSIVLGSPNMEFYKVIVDPGTGQVLSIKDLSMMDWMMMMHGEKHGGKMMMDDGWHNGYGKGGHEGIGKGDYGSGGYHNKW